MWKKTKQFLKLVGYESRRLVRNKVLFALLISFSIVLLLFLSFIQVNTSSYPLAIFTDGVDIESVGVIQLIDENLEASKITYVNSEEEGIDMIKTEKACFFIRIVAGEGTDQTTAIFYYDQANIIGQLIADNLSNAKNKYTYEKTNEFLSKYGITLNETYFDLISFESASDIPVSITQRSFVIEVACCLSLVLMLGLAYSLARDNETQISKNMAYIPVGINRYLLSKVVPYFVLGLFQISAMFLLGVACFDLKFQTNILLSILLSSFFILAILMMGLLFSLLKSQIATITLDILVVFLPTFVVLSVYLQACPMWIQIMLNAIPVTPFISFLKGLIFNGVILWWYIPIFIAEIVGYYLIALFIMKKRVQE